MVSSRTAPMNFTRLTCGLSVAMKLVFASINFKSFLLLPSVDQINTDYLRFANESYLKPKHRIRKPLRASFEVIRFSKMIIGGIFAQSM